MGFLKLKEGSRAIDKGENIGQFFVGEAPDLGAYEFGIIKSSSSVASSNSVAESSSSEGSTTAIAAISEHSLQALNSVTVFDLQGRYLGKMKLEKIKTPGIYLIRQGNLLQKVNVK